MYLYFLLKSINYARKMRITESEQEIYDMSFAVVEN